MRCHRAASRPVATTAHPIRELRFCASVQYIVMRGTRLHRTGQEYDRQITGPSRFESIISRKVLPNASLYLLTYCDAG